MSFNSTKKQSIHTPYDYITNSIGTGSQISGQLSDRTKVSLSCHGQPEIKPRLGGRDINPAEVFRNALC